jgi:hypothetical protein
MTAVIVIGIPKIPAWIKEYKAESFIRAFPDDVQPFAQTLEQSSCLMEAKISHAWFKSEEPMPKQLRTTDPVLNWEKAGFTSYAAKANARLKDVDGLPALMVQTQIEQIAAADSHLKEAQGQLARAIAARDANSHDAALAAFHAAKGNADSALSSAQAPLMHFGGICPDLE